jgi:hypothetical protein
MIDPLYFVLGFLGEYDGRTITPDDPNLVEFLFSDECRIEREL